MVLNPIWYPDKRKFGHTERHQAGTCTEERPREDTARRWPFASQRQKPLEKQDMQTP